MSYILIDSASTEDQLRNLQRCGLFPKDLPGCIEIDM